MITGDFDDYFWPTTALYATGTQQRKIFIKYYRYFIVSYVYT